MYKYAFEGTVIVVGILFSFYIEEMRIESKNIEIKNELLNDLNRAVKNDLEQIENVQKLLNKSQLEINEILRDINNNHKHLSDIETIEKLISINVSVMLLRALGGATYKDDTDKVKSGPGDERGIISWNTILKGITLTLMTCVAGAGGREIWKNFKLQSKINLNDPSK